MTDLLPNVTKVTVIIVSTIPRDSRDSFKFIGS